MTQKVILDLEDLVKIADSIREQIDSENKMRFKEMPDLISGIAADGTLYLLEDEEGNQAYATMIGDTPVDITATANDIRIGSTAVTSEGVTVGTKDIPLYHTTEGVQTVLKGKEFRIRIRNNDRYNYTKMQAVICPFNTSLSNSVATDKVCINDNIYSVNDTISIATVTLDHENKEIVLGITNETNKNYIIRYFSYKGEI